MLKQHPILKYIERQGVTQAQFAREVGVTPQRIHQLVTDRHASPRRNLAKRIVELTGGDISFADLYSWEPPKSPKPRKKRARKARDERGECG